MDRLCPWNVMDDLPVDDAVDMFYDFAHAAVSDNIPVDHLYPRNFRLGS